MTLAFAAVERPDAGSVGPAPCGAAAAAGPEAGERGDRDVRLRGGSGRGLELPGPGRSDTRRDMRFVVVDMAAYVLGGGVRSGRRAARGVGARVVARPGGRRARKRHHVTLRSTRHHLA